METNIAANNDGIVGDIILSPGTLVNTDDLVMEIALK
jgi:pyruvate carboxylase